MAVRLRPAMSRGMKDPSVGDSQSRGAGNSPVHTRTQHSLRVLVWLIMGWTILALDSFSLVSAQASSLLFAALAIVWGIRTFWLAGGVLITASSMFGIAVSIFVGLAGALSSFAAPSADLIPIMALSYFSAVLASLFFPTGLRWPRGPQHHVPPGTCRSGFAIAAVCGTLGFTTFLPEEVASSFAFSGIILATNLLLYKGRAIAALSVAAVGVGAYLAYYWDGFGRLIIGVLGLALAASFAPWFNSRSVKLITLLFLIPGILVLASTRIALQESLNPNGSNDDTGLGSLAAPMHTGGQVLDLIRAGAVVPTGGSTYLASLTAIVPRTLWNGKPPGWGAQITEYTKPELSGTGHSEAASAFVEPIWNFGMAGALLFVPLIGLSVGAIDRGFYRAYGCRSPGLAEVLLASGAILLASGIPDFVWGGSFTFVVRAGFRLIFLLAIAAPILLLHRSGKRALPHGQAEPVVRPSAPRQATPTGLRTASGGRNPS